jgi:hypothetical protein
MFEAQAKRPQPDNYETHTTVRDSNEKFTFGATKAIPSIIVETKIPRLRLAT